MRLWPERCVEKTHKWQGSVGSLSGDIHVHNLQKKKRIEIQCFKVERALEEILEAYVSLLAHSRCIPRDARGPIRLEAYALSNF